MLKKFIKDSSIYSVSNILASALSIFLLPLYTRVFVPADYGIIDILNIVSTLISLTIALEISQAVGRFTADDKSGSEKSRYFSTALLFSFIAYSLFVTIGILNSKYLSQLILDSNEKSNIIIVTLLSVWAGGIFNLLRNQLRWLSRSEKYSVVNFIFSLISITMTALLVLVVKIGITGVFYGLFFGSIVCSLLAFCFLRDSFVFAFDSQKLLEMLNFSVPLVPSSVSVFVFIYIDRIIIKQLMTFNDLGLYGVAYKMASILGLLLGGAQMALTPIIYTHYNEKNTPLELAKLSRYFTLFAFIVILGMNLFAKEILMVFTTPIYYESADVIPYLVFSIFFSGIYVFAPGLWISKKTKIIALINICAAVVNVVLNYIFIPIWGIKGAGIATLISACILFCINQILSQKYYPIPYPWKKFSLCLLIVSLIILLNNILSDFLSFLSISIKIIFMLAGAFIITYMLINKNELLTFKEEIKNNKNIKLMLLKLEKV